VAPPAQAPSSQTYAPLWLKVLVVVMGLLIIAGFVVVAVEIARRMSSPNAGRTPAGTAYSERIALPSGSQVISINAVGDRLAVHVEDRDGLTTAYIVDPRTGALVGTIAFPPGTGH
jgi:hypothetical protein